MKNGLKTIEKIAKEVYKELGPGHEEAIYDNAMRVGLRLAGIKYESQKVLEIKYRDYYVGEKFLDLIAYLTPKKRIIIELKTAEKIGPVEEQQIKHYQKLTKAC